MPPATRPGLTLTLDDMSAVAVAEGDLPRAARLRGAARNLTVETGAGLAGYVEDTFETGGRPGRAARRCPTTSSRATGRRVRPWTLDEAIALRARGRAIRSPRTPGTRRRIDA